MKIIITILATLSCISANAQSGSLDIFNCTMGESQTGDISAESLQLENGTQLYAPVFNGDIAAGSGAVELSSRTGNDMVFVKPNDSGQTTVTLTAIGSNDNLDLTNYKYVERIDTEEVSHIPLCTGFCTGYNITQ